MSIIQFRLGGGLKKFEFQLEDDGVCEIFAHHPGPEEITLAQKEAGIDLGKMQDLLADQDPENPKMTQGHMDLLLQQGHAAIELACLCIESIYLRHGEKVDTVPVIRAPHRYGLTTINTTLRAGLHLNVLRAIGKGLLEDSSLSQEETFPSGSLPSGSTLPNSSDPGTTAPPVDESPNID
ncbi:MAG: hypothetical protein ABIK28_16055 [Planctomycetota bacterium]